MRRVLLVLAAALMAAVPLAGFTGGTASAADCWHTFHARPTGTGWVSDPCAQRNYSDGFVTAAVRVQHWWSQSGGAHIEDIRGTFTICNDNPNDVMRVSADAVALHRRTDCAEYASRSSRSRPRTSAAPR